MAEVQIKDFDRRAARIVKRHKRMSHGYVEVVQKNGIVTRRPVRDMPKVSKVGILGVVLALILFKAFLFEALGPKTYEERVAKLAGGTVIEQAGAFVMSPDPVTLFIVDTYRANF